MKKLIVIILTILFAFVHQTEAQVEKSAAYKKATKQKGIKNVPMIKTFNYTENFTKLLNLKVNLLDETFQEEGKAYSCFFLFKKETQNTYPLYVILHRSQKSLTVEVSADTSLPGKKAQFQIIFSIKHKLEEKYFEITNTYSSKYFEELIGNERIKSINKNYNSYRKSYFQVFKTYKKKGFEDPEIISGMRPILEREEFIFQYFVRSKILLSISKTKFVKYKLL
jgi:hypothetical protein